MRLLLSSLLLYCFIGNAFAHEVHDVSNKIYQDITGILDNIFTDNAKYVKFTPDAEIRQIYKGQAPRATILACSDSRVQSVNFEDNPVNDLFFVRNIGNQITNSEGSVEYGVRKLHTPVLMIIGHTDCGAVKAVLHGYQEESKAIRHELGSMHISKSLALSQAVIINVHNQVEIAIKKFAQEVKEGSLVIVGAVYDFQNLYKHGYDRLILLNFNGEKDKTKIKNIQYLQKIRSITQ